jgi:hypothetical protein
MSTRIASWEGARVKTGASDRLGQALRILLGFPIPSFGHGTLRGDIRSGKLNDPRTRNLVFERGGDWRSLRSPVYAADPRCPPLSCWCSWLQPHWSSLSRWSPSITREALSAGLFIGPDDKTAAGDGRGQRSWLGGQQGRLAGRIKRVTGANGEGRTPMPLRALEPKCIQPLGGEWRMLADQQLRRRRAGVNWRVLAAHLLRICYGVV